MSDKPDQALPSGEQVLTVAAGLAAAVFGAMWAGHQLSVLWWSGRWAETPIGQAPRLAWHVLTDPTNPPGGVPPDRFYPSLIAVVLVVGAGAAAARLLWRAYADSDEDQGVRWAEPRDLKPLLVRHAEPGRLSLGSVGRRRIATEAQHSVAVIGPSGTGKTTGLAIPALLEWDGPVVATSVKADLLEHTIDHRQSVGDVWVYDPTASTGLPSAGWDPLAMSDSWQGALRMAAWLVSTGKAGDRGGLQDSDFWYAVSQKLLAPLLLAAATSGRSMRDVVRWVDLQEEDEVIDALQRAGDLDALQAFAATAGREDRSRSSAYTTTETVLSAFSDPGVLATTVADPAITVDRLLDGGHHTLYVCGPLHEQARLRPLFTALIEQVVHGVYQRANHPDTHLTKPLLLVIDEAANVAPLPDLAQLASTARGVGIQLVTVWQDLAQLEARYGTFSQTVINNHRAKLVLSGVSDTATLDYISRLIGEEASSESSETRDHDGSVRSTTTSTRRQPLAPPATLRQAKTGSGVLVYGNLAPAQVTLQPWDARRRLRRRTTGR